MCLYVPRRIPTLLYGPGCKLGNGRGYPPVVHYWADLQLVHMFRCYGNKAKCQQVTSVSLYAWFILLFLVSIIIIIIIIIIVVHWCWLA